MRRKLFMKADSGSSARNKNLVFCVLCWATVCIMEGMRVSDCSGCVHQDYSAGNKKTGRISDRLKGTPESKPRKSSPMRATDLPVHWGSVCLETQWVQRAFIRARIQKHRRSENPFKKTFVQVSLHTSAERERAVLHRAYSVTVMKTEPVTSDPFQEAEPTGSVMLRRSVIGCL